MPPGDLENSRAINTPTLLASDLETIKCSVITFNINADFTTARSQVKGSVNRSGTIIPETVHFLSTATHELGHAMGLGHVGNHDTTALMHSPQKNETTNETIDERELVRTINATDRANFRLIYDKNPRSRGSVMISSELHNEENYLYLRNIPENNQNYDINMVIEICYEPLDDSELIDQSDLIIKGRVKEILPTEWTTEDGRSISQNNIQDVNILTLFHSVVVEVDETYKGELKTDEIIIHKSGGTSDNIRITTSNPEYYENEEVILCLKEGIDDSGVYYYQINAGSQIFIIDDDLGVNGRGEKINIPELIKELENYTASNQQGE